MFIKQISAENSNEEIRQLYESAFPEDEKTPWDVLMKDIGELPLDFLAYYDDDTLIGFTIVLPGKTINWLCYFAVEPEQRGKGYGQIILEMLKEQYKGRDLIVDMESPEQVCDNQEQRLHRHAFYLRNGFRDTDVEKTFGHTDMKIMMVGDEPFTKQDFDAVSDEL